VQGLPFAIWGVASALDIVSELIASVRKNMITLPITVVTFPVFVAGCISPSNLSARGYADAIEAAELRRIYRAEAVTISIGLRANSSVFRVRITYDNSK
jgi:hypothetical protein